MLNYNNRFNLYQRKYKPKDKFINKDKHKFKYKDKQKGRDKGKWKGRDTCKYKGKEKEKDKWKGRNTCKYKGKGKDKWKGRDKDKDRRAPQLVILIRRTHPQSTTFTTVMTRSRSYNSSLKILRNLYNQQRVRANNTSNKYSI